MSQKSKNTLLFNIALVLKDLRKAKGVSQEDVFVDTGIHIGRIEAGKSDPRVSTLEKLIGYFEVGIGDFWGLVEKKGAK